LFHPVFREPDQPALRFAGIHETTTKEAPMLYWALIFLVVALIAGLFGFGGVASASVGIAQILFVLFLILAAVAFVVQLVRGR
jgi:uncharacterized membrane protein YtjA (UPF0391 family)